MSHRPPTTRPRRGWRAVLASLALAGVGLVAPAASASPAPAATHAVRAGAAHAERVHTTRVGARDATPNKPSGDSGTTIDPLQYGCQNDHATCGNNGANRGGVGSSYAYYGGADVQLLYTENWYCDSNVSASSSTGCEVGAGPSGSPSATSSGGTGTSLGNTTHGDTLYIPVPLFSNPPATQCGAGDGATVTCIDHPKTVDLSRLGGAFASDTNVGIPAHNHVIGTRNSGNPEWWNVQVIATQSPSTFASLTSVAAINAALTAHTAISAPSNIYLFFQVLPGTVPAAIAENPAVLNADTFPPGTGASASPAPGDANQAEVGPTFNNLSYDCQQTAPNCEGVGIAHAWVGQPAQAGQDVQLLYSEGYQCLGNSNPGAAPCEVGKPATAVPAGVSDPTVPTAANSAPGASGGNGQIDPLYIPVPIGFTPDYAQCPGAITCIDHPMTVDLSNIAGALPGKPSPASLTNVPLPSHDHVIRTRNQDAPEWWNVEVVPVTSQAQLTAIESAKGLTSAQEQPNSSSNAGGAIDTNVYLWFQTLPGQAAPTPGPTQPSACMATLPSGQVVGATALPDGTGTIEVDRAGDVAVQGGATCYGSLTGTRLNAPIVGIAADRTTGGYWLTAADGGVFAFNAPFLGSEGGARLNRPVVGIATDLNSVGYYLVASDGGIFAFGEPFKGSRGGQSLNAPIVGMAVDPLYGNDGTGGYWLVAADGGVFAYNVPFYGSRGGQPLNQPVVAMTTVSDGSGYRLIASDGGVFSYNAPFYGSTGGMHLNQPVIAGANDNGTDGYWLFAADGGVFTFGYPLPGGGIDTPFYGSAA